MASDVSVYLEPGETLLWRGQPDRQHYLAFAGKLNWRVNVFGFAAAVTVCYLMLHELGSPARFLVAFGVASALLPLNVFTQRWRLSRTQFLGDYAVTDRRVLAVPIRGRLRQMPLDSALTCRLIGDGNPGTVEFKHPVARRFRFGCLAQRDFASLQGVLGQLRHAGTSAADHP